MLQRFLIYFAVFSLIVDSDMLPLKTYLCLSQAITLRYSIVVLPFNYCADVVLLFAATSGYTTRKESNINSLTVTYGEILDLLQQ